MQGNYPNFKQYLAEKNIVIKSQRKPVTAWQILSQSSKVAKVGNCVLSKEQRIRKPKSSQKRHVFSRNSQKTRQKDFWRTPCHMGTQERLRNNSRHILEAIFRLMRVVVNYRTGKKQLKKNCSTTKEYLGQTTYIFISTDRMLFSASPSNPVRISKPSSLLLFVQPDKKFLEESPKVKETYFLTNFGNKSMRKFRSQSKLASELIDIHIA